jgi:hypothetical protein
MHKCQKALTGRQHSWLCKTVLIPLFLLLSAKYQIQFSHMYLNSQKSYWLLYDVHVNMWSCNKLPSDKYTDDTLNITFYIIAFIKIKVLFKQNNNDETTPHRTIPVQACWNRYYPRHHLKTVAKRILTKQNLPNKINYTQINVTIWTKQFEFSTGVGCL